MRDFNNPIRIRSIIKALLSYIFAKKYYKCFHSTIKHKLRIKVSGYHFIFLTSFLYLMTQKCLLLYFILVSFYRPLFSCQQLSELLHHTAPSSCAIVCSILMHLVPKTIFPDSHHHVYHVIITCLCLLFSHIKLEPNRIISVTENWHVHINYVNFYYCCVRMLIVASGSSAYFLMQYSIDIYPICFVDTRMSKISSLVYIF